MNKISKKLILIFSLVVLGGTALFFFFKGEKKIDQPEVATIEGEKGEELTVFERPEEPEPPVASHQGSFKLTTTPDAAHLVVTYGDKTVEGETPFEIQIPFEGSEIEIKATVSKSAYANEDFFFLLTEETPHGEFHVDLSEAAKARVSVQAVPWGRVGVDQKENLQESPLMNYPVFPGKHTVWVYHPPTNQWLQESVSLASSTHIRCIARFGEGSAISCR